MTKSRQYDSRVRKPVKTLVEGIEFASEWEASVYRHIRMLYPKECIQCHQPVSVLPESLHFPPLNWRCDFKLTIPGRTFPLYIEAKGVATQEFKLVLQSLAHTQPEIFPHLLVVHSEIGVRIGKTVKTVNIHLMYQILQKLKPV